MTNITIVIAGVFGLLIAAPVSAADKPAKGFSGEMALGGSLATGNSSRKRLDADIHANFRNGRFEDRYKFFAEAADENGRTVAQRLQLGLQSNYDIGRHVYATAFGQFEDDRASGFNYEVEGGAGLGYRVLRLPGTEVSIDGGLGYRYSATGILAESESRPFVRTTASSKYAISPQVRLTNEMQLSVDGERTKVENTLALTSTLMWGLGARMSFNVRYNSTQPALIRSTDTLTKVGLVYGF